MLLSEHFDSHEFECPCCGQGGEDMDLDLIALLEDVRTHFNNRPVVISSGYRCAIHNHAVGGADDSQHLYGKAADIRVHGVSPAKVQQYLQDHEGGLGSYATFTHVDVRGHRARW